MPRIKIVLNKTNTQKLNSFFKWVKNTWENIDIDEFSTYLTEKIKTEIKNLREYCSEKLVVETWIKYLQGIDIPESFIAFKKNFKEHCVEVRGILSSIATNKTFDNNIDIYFNEVAREYIMHPQNEQNEVEFNLENRDIFIKNNLRLVIECAKRYQHMGVPFDDLIQAGNEGLLSAFDRFKTNKSNLRETIIKNIKESELESFTHDEAEEIIKNAFTYGKLLDSTLKKIPVDGFDSKDDFIDWCAENIKAAVFASVAFHWIRASIIGEILKMGSIIKLPKASKSEGDDGSNTAKIIRLDSINPYTEDNYSDGDLASISNEEFIIEDETVDKAERQEFLSIAVTNMLSDLDYQSRQIVKKRFGIGIPYQMTISEIAESENISVGNVKRLLHNAIVLIQSKITDSQRNALMDLL